jgi:hypothetical protein
MPPPQSPATPQPRLPPSPTGRTSVTNRAGCTATSPPPACGRGRAPGTGLAAPAAPTCDHGCPDGLGVLCAAVLAAAAAAAALAAAARRRVLPARARDGLRARPPAAARRLPTGPDSVAELCVSRT